MYLDEIGACAAVETVVIQPQVSGRVAEIHFTDGAEVRQGDPLFTIDERPFRAEVAKAQANLARNRAKLEFAQDRLKRAEKLRSAGTIAPEEYDLVKSDAAAADAQVDADEALIETAKINLEYCRIRSPIEGRVGDRLIDGGNIVEENKARLLVVRRMDPIYAQFTIPEADLPRVRRSLDAQTLTALVEVPSDREARREGKLDFLDNSVQDASGTVRLRAILKNNDRRFWPGQFVKVRLLLETLRAAVLVSGRAVQVGQQGPLVFVVKEDAAVELRQVKPGQRHGDDVVILEGLKAGETVVVSGQLGLVPGAKVSVVAPTPQQPPPR